jgi:hypothetical protein
LPIHPF